MRLAPGQQVPVEVQHRIRIARLLVHGQFAVLGRNGQPGLRCIREPGAGTTLLPREGRSAAVASLELGPHANAVGILQLLEAQLDFRQAQLVALVDAGAAAQRHLHGRRQPGDCLTSLLPTPAGADARAVMIGNGP